MVKLEKFLIVLTKPQIVYMAGETVEGELLINLNRGMKMKGITVKCSGLSQVFWTEENKKVPGETITYSGSEEYIDQSVRLLETPTNEESVELPAGDHAYPFKFHLPETLPASFEGKPNCFIRYWIKGTIEKPWKIDKETKQPFPVVGGLDLNNEPKAKQKVRKERIEAIGGWCCETGPAYGKLKLMKSGYVPGEYIPCSAEINEGTGRGAHWSKIRLMMKTCYQTPKTKGTKVSKHSDVTQISVLQHGPINPGYDDDYDNEKILVPPLPPSYLRGCSIIDVSYYIELLVNIKHPTVNLTIKHDVIIGTVPLQSLVDTLTKPPKPPKWKKDFPITTQPGRKRKEDKAESMITPPSYRESVLGIHDVIQDGGGVDAEHKLFAPRYIYYDWIERRQAQMDSEARIKY